MNGYEFKKEIERIIQTARNMCPNITNDMLDSNGAIHYMNGNDGTKFDWECNNRLCEFYVYHENGRGFIKACVCNDDAVRIYIYEDGDCSPTSQFTEKLENVTAKSFAKIMNYIADEEEMWDKPINELDWNFDTSECFEI